MFSNARRNASLLSSSFVSSLRVRSETSRPSAATSAVRVTATRAAPHLMTTPMPSASSHSTRTSASPTSSSRACSRPRVQRRVPPHQEAKTPADHPATDGTTGELGRLGVLAPAETPAANEGSTAPPGSHPAANGATGGPGSPGVLPFLGVLAPVDPPGDYTAGAP